MVLHDILDGNYYAAIQVISDMNGFSFDTLMVIDWVSLPMLMVSNLEWIKIADFVKEHDLSFAISFIFAI